MKDLIEFKEFVDDLRRSSSRNYKIEVLERHKDSTAVRFFLCFVLNPYIATGISRKKLSKELPKAECRFGDVVGLLDYVVKNNTGKDEVVQQVQSFAAKIEDDSLAELFLRIVIKDLPLGVQVLTVNKVMPGLVPTFNVQLANKYFDDPSVVEGHVFTMTTKIDGGRIIALKRNGAVKFYTRAGQEYEGLVDLEKELASEEFPDNIMLDGEITLLNSEGLDNKQQYKQTMMITRRSGEKHGLRMKVFDILPVSDFIAQHSAQPYALRREVLESIFSKSKRFFTLLPVLYHGVDVSQILRVLDDQIAKGEEGAMINIDDAPYAFTRGNGLLKVKKMHDVDLEVLGFEEGTNQNEGKLGAFICSYKGFELKVGSGISKQMREEIWNNQAEYIGRTIIVQYFEETENQTGGKSLRFPVFIDFREDK